MIRRRGNCMVVNGSTNVETETTSFSYSGDFVIHEIVVNDEKSLFQLQLPFDNEYHDRLVSKAFPSQGEAVDALKAGNVKWR